MRLQVAKNKFNSHHNERDGDRASTAASTNRLRCAIADTFGQCDTRPVWLRIRSIGGRPSLDEPRWPSHADCDQQKSASTKSSIHSWMLIQFVTSSLKALQSAICRSLKRSCLDPGTDRVGLIQQQKRALQAYKTSSTYSWAKQIYSLQIKLCSISIQ